MLNTKNDEHEYELRGLEESYESEIQDILKSAFNKVDPITPNLAATSNLLFCFSSFPNDLGIPRG